MICCPHIEMSKSARSRIKTCEHCQIISSSLYRVLHDATCKWALVCNGCRLKVESLPFYRYGGTWKSDKRH